MANQRFRAATVYVSGTKIAEIAQSTYEHMSGEQNPIGLDGVVGQSEGADECKLSFDTICPVAGHAFTLKNIIKNKQTVTFAVAVDGGLESFDGRITTRSYTSDSKSGECKGKFEAIGGAPTIAA